MFEFSTTDDRGHCDQLGHGHALAIGTYRLHVDTQSYFQRAGQRCFYPYIDVSQHDTENCELISLMFQLFFLYLNHVLRYSL